MSWLKCRFVNLCRSMCLCGNDEVSEAQMRNSKRQERYLYRHTPAAVARREMHALIGSQRDSRGRKWRENSRSSVCPRARTYILFDSTTLSSSFYLFITSQMSRRYYRIYDAIYARRIEASGEARPRWAVDEDR